ncbi:hypothetical protein ABPG74_016978 [Tetrahymena malaccensis]
MSIFNDDHNNHSVKEDQKLFLSHREIDPSIIDQKKSHNHLIQFKVYNYRYINLAVFIISALANNLIVQTTTPIVNILHTIYPDYSKQVISLCALVFYVSHPPMAFVSNYIIEQKGLKFGITFGAILMIIGTGLRCLVNQGFYFVIIGQFINAVGNCFITNSPAKVAANWFYPKDRPAVTAIGTFAVLASGALGIVIPSIFVSETNNTDKDVFNLMLAEFIIVAAIMIMNIFFFRAEPPTPPSYGAMQKKENFKQSIKSLFTNVNYLLLLGFLTLVLGTVNSYFVTISLLIAPFGHTALDASLLSVFSTAFGFFGSIAGAIVLKITRKYKPIMFIGTLVASIMLLVNLALLTQDGAGFKWTAFIVSGLSAFFCYPVFSTVLEFGCEIAFPVGEASIAGYLLAGSQIFGFFLGLIMTEVIDGVSKERSYIGGIVYLGLVFLSLIPLSFTKQDLRRSQKEIEGTLINNPIPSEELEKEIKENYVVDNNTSKIIQEEIKHFQNQY